MPDTNNNFNIEVANLTDSYAKMASDWHSITHTSGTTSAHYQILKAAIGNEFGSTRNNEIYPIATTIRGQIGPLTGITGEIRATGSFFLQNSIDSYLVAGSTNTISSYRPVPAVGHIHGIQNGILFGITGFIAFAEGYTLYVQGITNAPLVGITGQRKLGNTDSFGITGIIGISGGMTLIAGRNSLTIRGYDLAEKIPIRLYASNGETLGISGDAINLNIVNAEILLSYTIGSSLGISNADGAAIKICGSGSTSTPPVVIQGKMAGGVLEIGATAGIKISTTGSMDLDDALLVDSLESTTKPLISNLITVKNSTTQIPIINEKISSNIIQSKITETIKSQQIVNGVSDITDTATPINLNFSLKTGVHIKAPISNTKSVYIGPKSLDSSFSSGFLLDPGESIFIEIDNLNKIYTRSEFSGQKIAYLAS